MTRTQSSARRTEEIRRRAEAGRAAAARAERRRRVQLAVGSVVAVLIVIGALVGIKLASGTGSTSRIAANRSTTTPAQAAAVVATLQAALPHAVAQAGSGNIADPLIAAGRGAKPLTAAGKPRVVYVGAEYCPFCAAERWPLVLALSRFGTFSGIGLTHSSTSDVYPGTRTLDFYGSSYTSPYLDFTPVELETNVPSGSGYAPLQKPTALESALLQTYDGPPYVSSQSAGSIPFVDFANRFLISGASYSPQLLAGMSWTQIADAASRPTSPAGEAIDATANYLTASLCTITGGRPASVCGTPLITGLQAHLPHPAAG